MMIAVLVAAAKVGLGQGQVGAVVKEARGEADSYVDHTAF